jgi:hypothetical protein
MNGLTITPKNIDEFIRTLRKRIKTASRPEQYAEFWVPNLYRDGIDRTKYKGRGRPKNTDYNWITFTELMTRYASR